MTNCSLPNLIASTFIPRSWEHIEERTFLSVLHPLYSFLGLQVLYFPAKMSVAASQPYCL